MIRMKRGDDGKQASSRWIEHEQECCFEKHSEKKKTVRNTQRFMGENHDGIESNRA